MAILYDTSGFFRKYRSVLICIGILVMVQAFLAFRMCFSHSENEFLPSQQGDQKNSVHGKGTTEGEKFSPQAQLSVSKTKPSSRIAPLNLDLLDFTPECEITIKDSISAIQRAKTQKCKEQLAKTACGIQRDSLYPKRLPRLCQSQEHSYGKHLGCYKDEKYNRLLNDSFSLKKEDNSPQSCVDLCLQSGFLYAGLEYSVECFCGNQPPLEISMLDPSLCYMKCPYVQNIVGDSQSIWNSSVTCGGYFAMDIYETGVFLDDEAENKVYGLEEVSKMSASISRNETVRIVFFLTVNGRALRQVIRLIKALFHERHFFFIHVDARQDYLFRQLLGLSRKLPSNIRLMTERKGSIWGGASLLTVLLSGMRELVLNAEGWKWSWDYVINLSESDFPLKTVESLENFLTLNKGKNFVKSHGRDVMKFIQKQGLDKTFDECEYRMWRMGDRVLPTGILVDGGSDWIALHHEFVEYLVKDEDELVSGLRKVFQYTLLPAESFFHTALRNSVFCKSFVDNNLHVTNWKRKLGCKCQYRKIVDWCGCSPNDFRLADWARLQLTESRIIFFGRKFESVVNQGIVNQLESSLYPQRHAQNFATLDRYWQSIYHHHDLSPKPDDALLTLGYSLSQIAMKTLQNSQTKDVDAINPDHLESYHLHVVEISVYLQDDQNQGILVRFSFESLNQDEMPVPRAQFEAWFTYQNWIAYDAENQSDFHSRILNLRVGTDYDQKEQIFRNFAGAMGPWSEPTLAYSCFTTEPFNVTFVWISPNHSIQSRQNVSIGIGETANFLKPTFRVPLMSGEWTVKLFDTETRLIAQTQFLIVPLGFHSQGSTLSRKRQDQTDKEELRSIDDSLISKFYLLQDLCREEDISQPYIGRWKSNGNTNTASEDELVKLGEKGFDSWDTTLCSHTQWSSRYPDPKSTVTAIDNMTGLLTP